MTDLAERTEQDLKEEARRWDAIWWAGTFIWIGLVLAGEYFDILPDIGDTSEWWPWIFVGIGPWSLILNGYRLVTRAVNPSTWDWIWTFVFVGVAVGALADFGGEVVGAAVLIGVGSMILFRALARRD